MADFLFSVLMEGATSKACRLAYALPFLEHDLLSQSRCNLAPTAYDPRDTLIQLGAFPVNISFGPMVHLERNLMNDECEKGRLDADGRR